MGGNSSPGGGNSSPGEGWEVILFGALNRITERQRRFVEKMENLRGITVSSSVRTIAEEIINRRLIKTIECAQVQAGGKKGASTTYHVFIIRNIMQIAKKEGRHLLISYFDVNTIYFDVNTICCTRSTKMDSLEKYGD